MRYNLRKKDSKGVIVLTINELNKLRISTGLVVPISLWDGKRQRVKGNSLPINNMNAKLVDWEAKVQKALATSLSLQEDICSSKERVYKVLGLKVVDEKKETLLLPFFLLWLSKGTATKTNYKRADLYSYNLYKSILSPNITFNDVDYNCYTNILKRLRERGLRENTIGSHIKILKAVMNEAYKRGLHNNLSYKQFAKPQEAVDTIYLNKNDLNKIKEVVLPEKLAKARDLFLLGCYTAMRYSDYSRIVPEWIKEDKLHFTETKTSNRNVIPLSSSARTIIEKYKGAPKLSETKLNIYIKEVCKIAGIDDVINITYTAGGKKVTEQKKKWQLVSTHTARRTGATLLIKAGAPIAWVMRLTGHRTEQSFWKYVRLSAEEYADLTKSFIEKI